MDGHLAALARVQHIPVALIHIIGNREAAPQQHARLAILRKHQIIGGQRRSAADMRRLLAAALHVERDATLALRLVQNFVQHAEQHHFPEHLRAHVARQLRLGGTVERRPGGAVEHPIDGHRGDAAGQS